MFLEFVHSAQISRDNVVHGCSLPYQSDDVDTAVNSRDLLILLTTVDTEVAVVFVQRFQSCDIWRIFDDFIDPLDALDHLVATKIDS